MKFYNPYESRKDRITTSITNNYLPNMYYKFLKMRKIILKNLVKNRNKLCRFDLDYEFLTHTNKYNRKNKLNHDQKIKLTDLVIEELVEINSLNDLEKGLNNIFNEFHPYSYFDINPINGAKEFIDSIKKNCVSDMLSNIGMIEFPENHELNKFIKYVDIALESFTVSHIRIRFFVALKDKSNDEIVEILNKDYDDVKKIYINKLNHGSIKNSIGVLKQNGETFRTQDVQNLLLYLKWKILKSLSNYIPLYFSNENIVAPSLEFFEGSNIFGECSHQCNMYLDNLGIPKIYLCNVYEYNKNSGCEIYEDSYSTGFDSNSTKIILNKGNTKEMYKGQILLTKQSIAKEMFVPLIIETVCDNLDYYLLNCKINIKKNSINKTNYKKLFNIRCEIEQKIILFNSIKNYLDNKNISININELNELLNITNSKSFINDIFEYNERQINSIEKDINENKKLLDDIISLSNIRFSRRSQIITIALAIITAILTMITIINSPFIKYIWNFIADLVKNLVDKM